MKWAELRLSPEAAAQRETCELLTTSGERRNLSSGPACGRPPQHDVAFGRKPCNSAAKLDRFGATRVLPELPPAGVRAILKCPAVVGRPTLTLPGLGDCVTVAQPELAERGCRCRSKPPYTPRPFSLVIYCLKCIVV